MTKEPSPRPSFFIFHFSFFILHSLILALIVPFPAAAAGEDLGQLEQQAFRAAVDRIAPCVVQIETIGGLEQADNMLLGTGPTTGVIVDPEGYLVSSAFNFVNQPTSILVRLPSGARRPARLLATDHNRMLVLLKIDPPEPLPVPEAVPADQMHVGQWTIAVGRAFDSQHTNVSVGILSAVGRVWGKAVQTDAAVSPNNYGGPLVDLQGRVLGVLAPLSPQADSEVSGVEWYDSGIGFAVPLYDILRVLPRLKKGENLRPGLMGISFRSRALHTEPPIIGYCHPTSPARKAGLKVGDRIVEIDGRKVERAAQFKEAISPHYAGEKLQVTVLREKKRIQCELELVGELTPYEHPSLGILPQRMASLAGRTGIWVRYVEPDGPAAKAGLKEGDHLVAMNGKPITDREELVARLADLEPGTEVQLEAERDGTSLKLRLVLGRIPTALPPQDLPPAGEPTQSGEAKAANTGTVQIKIPELTNEIWSYVPENYDSKRAQGVVIYLHGPEGLDPPKLIAQWKPLCDRYGLILAAPKATDKAQWLPTELALVSKLLDDLDAKYTVDPARVVLFGEATGGNLAFAAAFRQREQVRGVVAVDAGLRGPAPDTDPAYRQAFFFARADSSRQAAAAKASIELLRKKKFPVTVQELGPAARPLADEELAEIARWIDMLDRI
jgi:serine protease Do